MKLIYKRTLIGVSTIVLIIIMVIFIDFQVIVENLNKITIWGILLFVLVYSVAFFLRTIRLKQIFKSFNYNTSFLTLFCTYGIGWGINDITPGKIGDFVRIELIREKEHGIGLSKSICGVAIERIIDIVILFLITCIAFILMYVFNVSGTSQLNLQFYLGIGSIILIGAVIGLLFLFFKSEWILNIVGKISNRLKILLERFLKDFLEGIKDFLKSRDKVFNVFILSLFIWFLESLPLVFFFYLTGYEIHIFIVILAQIIYFFSMVFPITPGGWVISDNIGALLIFIFYPSLLYSNILAIFILYHAIATIYIFVFGIGSALTLAIGFDIKFRELNIGKTE